MINIDKLEKRYKDFSLDVTMRIEEGSITGLIGKNGAGKSTVIKAILGLIRPEGGSVTVMGKEAFLLSTADKEKLGVALSDSGFSGYLCIKDALKILKTGYERFDEQGFLRGCSEMGLPMDKPIKDFSTGMKAKFKVLTALTHQADVLILDEPTSGLDVEARMDILDMLRRFMEENERRSILITSHISSDLEDLCDDIYLIHKGRVVLHEEAHAIPDRYGIIKVDEEGLEKLDRTHVLALKKERFGYACLTDQRQYYEENVPGLIVERGDIDRLILMLTGRDEHEMHA